MEEPTKHIGEMIKTARLKAGLTQKELGERMGTSESAISKLEKRKTTPNLQTLERIAKALGTKLNVSFDWKFFV